MAIGPEHEAARPPAGEGFTDAVTYAFGDRVAGLYGLARLGLSPAPDGGVQASGLGVLFSGREPVGVVAEGAVALGADADWTLLELPGMSAAVESPLERWTVAMTAGDGTGFELELAAISMPAPFEAGGMTGYEQLCRVSGTVRAGDDVVEIDGLGQRGHAWGDPDWDSIELTRSVSAWLGDDALGGVAFSSARPVGTPHAAELVAAMLVEGGEAVEVIDPRLSTTYDGDGHTRRAGLELWVTEDGYPLRAAGEVVCGTTMDLGALRLDLAFMRWHAEGRDGVGRYEILRRT